MSVRRRRGGHLKASLTSYRKSAQVGRAIHVGTREPELQLVMGNHPEAKPAAAAPPSAAVTRLPRRLDLVAAQRAQDAARVVQASTAAAPAAAPAASTSVEFTVRLIPHRLRRPVCEPRQIFINDDSEEAMHAAVGEALRRPEDGAPEAQRLQALAAREERRIRSDAARTRRVQRMVESGALQRTRESMQAAIAEATAAAGPGATADEILRVLGEQYPPEATVVEQAAAAPRRRVRVFPPILPPVNVAPPSVTSRRRIDVFPPRRAGS